MNLNEKKWKEFIIKEIFDEINNSKPYHKKNLKTSKSSTFPYITRTTNNNGLEMLIDNSNFNINPKNTIVFGAETKTFFYEPFEYITGNKMYYIKDKHFNRYVCLFLINVLNSNIQEKYGYARGLTAERFKKERILLPVNDKNEPDFEFMEEYIKNIEKNLINKYREHLNKLTELRGGIELKNSNELKWAPFQLEELGKIISGKDIYEDERIIGDIPYITSKSEDNGIGHYIKNTNNTLQSNAISINRNGAVGYAFYHPYKALYSNDCRKFVINKSKYVSLFIVNQIKLQKDIFNYGYKMGTNRLKKTKIMLPVINNGDINYEYMEKYMINIEIKLIEKYLNFLNS